MALRYFRGRAIQEFGEIQAVEDAVTNAFNEIKNLASYYSNIVLSSSYAVDTSDIEAVEIPDIDWDTVSITGALAYMNTVLANVLALPTHHTLNYGTPPELTAPTTVSEYDDSLREALATSIIGDLNSGGYGIKTDNERMLFEIARDKSNAEMDKAMANAFLSGGAVGTSRPPGSMYRSISNLTYTQRNGLMELNDKLVNDSNERFIKSKIETYNSAIDVSKIILDEFVMLLKVAVAVYKANMEKYYWQIKSRASIIESEYDNYSVKIQSFVSQMEAMYKSYQALAGIQEFGFKEYNSVIMGEIEETKAILAALLDRLKLYVGEGDAKVKAYAALASSALSGMDINVRLSSSYNGSESASTSSSESFSADSSKTNTSATELEINLQADGAGEVPWVE